MLRIIDWLTSWFSRDEEWPEPDDSALPRVKRHTGETAVKLMPRIYDDPTVPDLTAIAEPEESDGFNPYDTAKLHLRKNAKE